MSLVAPLLVLAEPVDRIVLLTIVKRVFYYTRLSYGLEYLALPSLSLPLAS